MATDVEEADLDQALDVVVTIRLYTPSGPSAGAATVTPSRTSRTEGSRWPTRFR